MSYRVYLVKAAELDILDIYNFVAHSDSHLMALELVESLESTCETLTKFPEQGRVPPELERAGIYGYRQIHFKPYRIIYQIENDSVYIICILDGRRNLSEVMQRRLLRPE